MIHERYELPLYSRSKIEKAGKAISRNDEGSPEYDEYLPVVDNWRASHAYALDTISALVNEAVGADENTFVVHRIKRLDSIVGKLKRAENTGLFRMQDLGGCRVIVDNLDYVYSGIARIKEVIIESGHEILKENDYIKLPRSISGYRSYHIVVKFHCAEEPLFDGMLIEIQIRTKLEHIWATAVEMMDIITEETLKSGTGKIEYMRFFKLVSGLFSIAENTPIVEGVDNEENAIIEEIYSIDRVEHIRDILASYNQAINIVNTEMKDDEEIGYYLLMVNRFEKSITIRAFKKDNVEYATTVYQEFEKHKRELRIDVVLISVNSLNIIQDAYPNYFMMTFDFLEKLSTLCAKHPEKSNYSFSSIGVGVKLLELFNTLQIEANIPDESMSQRDTMGSPRGSMVYIPRHPMNLGVSYLRFSAPYWDDEKMFENCIPQRVVGPGIIVTRHGGCYYMNSDEWKYICDEKSLLIQCKDKTDYDKLLVLLCWMKTNLFAWDILWNFHAHSVFPKRVHEQMWVPALCKEDETKIIELSKNIIQEERQFVEGFIDEGYESYRVIDDFNQSISAKLLCSEAIFDRYYQISPEGKQIIQQELSINGYYFYE